MDDSPDLTTSTSDGALPIGSASMRALLNRHGIPAMRHVTTIAGILGVAYTQVHRRMNGSVAWEIEELQKVAATYGETLGDLFSDADSSEHVSAVLSVDGVRVPCQLLPGDVVSHPERNSLVAIKVGAQWVVVPADEAGASSCFCVLHLELSSKQRGAKTVAILDDDDAEAQSLAEYFSELGCEAHAFTDAEELLDVMRLRRFDGFVIDWVLREGSAAELVAMIRSENRDCPIAILTGQIESDVRVESDVAEALTTHRLMFFQKPTRLPLLTSQLLRAMAGQ